MTALEGTPSPRVHFSETWLNCALCPSVQQQPRGLVRLHRGSRARPQPRHEPRRRPTVHVSHRCLHHELWSHVRRTRRATPHAHTCPHTLTLTPNASPLCRGSKNFSSCSADDFEKMILLTGGACLLNVPRPDEAYSAPYCGNRLVDFGEECDCGSEKVWCVEDELDMPYIRFDPLWYDVCRNSGDAPGSQGPPRFSDLLHNSSYSSAGSPTSTPSTCSTAVRWTSWLPGLMFDIPVLY